MSRRWYVVGLLGLAAPAVAYIAGIVGPENRPSGDPGFLSPDAELELLVDGEDLTEGVRRDLRSTRPVQRDAQAQAKRRVPDGRILEYHPDTRAVSVFRSPSNGANGNRMDLACRLLTAERYRPVRTDPAHGRGRGGRRLRRGRLVRRAQ